MKKNLAVLAMLVCLPLSVGCHWIPFAFLFMNMGTEYETDIAKYGQEDEYVKEQLICFPESLEDCEGVKYSYTLYSYMDTCYEVFLEINGTKEQLEELLQRARSREEFAYEQPAYYAEGYIEIVFFDEYEGDTSEEDGEKNVGFATVDKIVYNPETGNVVFESFHAHDTGVYALKDVAYFQRFAIEETQYIENLGERNGEIL